jgi:hypothetical protein
MTKLLPSTTVSTKMLIENEYIKVLEEHFISGKGKKAYTIFSNLRMLSCRLASTNNKTLY